MRTKTFFITGLVFFASSMQLNSQRVEAGFKVINELFLNNYGPGLGGIVLINMSKHSGIETGIFYKINPRSSDFSGVYIPNPVVKEKTLMVPFMYRFNNRIFNLGAGGTTSYILNYNESKNRRSHETGKVEFAAAISISKSFVVEKVWVIEPEIRSSATIPEGGVATSLNFSIRKTF